MSKKKEATKPKSNQKKNKHTQFILFFGVAAVVLLINLLITNDYTTLWNGAESELILAAQGIESTWAFAPNLKLKAIIATCEFQSFWLRLPSVMLLFASFFVFWLYGKRIFGGRTTLNIILIMGSSLLIPNISKLATGDTWLLGSQLLAVTTLILYLKKPDNKLLFLHFCFVTLGAFVHAPSMLVMLLILFIYWKNKHPQGENLGVKTWSWLIPLGVYLFGKFALELDTFSEAGSYFSFLSTNPIEYFAYMLLGILPWIAFLPAAVIDMFAKLKRKEEMSILTSGWLLASIFSLSIGLQAIFAFLIAKQIQAYFHPNYPYKNWVRGMGTIQVVFAFVGGMILMLNGFYVLGMEGFRLGMALGASFWIPAFLGVVGLYGNNNRMIMGGMAISGLLLTFVFWARISPVLESFRKMPKEVISGIEKGQKNDLFIFGMEELPDNLRAYGHSKFREVKDFGREEFRMQRATNKDIILMKDSFPSSFIFTEKNKIDTIRGWNERILEEEVWLKLEKK